MGAGQPKRYIGEICLSMEKPKFADIDIWIVGAIGADDENGMRLNLGQDYALYGQYGALKGDRKLADEYQDRALQIFSDCGCGRKPTT